MDVSERLGQLREERARGERQLELLDRHRAELRDTLLRIAGAIQVLEELQEASPLAVEVARSAGEGAAVAS